MFPHLGSVVHTHDELFFFFMFRVLIELANNNNLCLLAACMSNVADPSWSIIWARKTYGNLPVNVVGHSTGGDLASFCALDLFVSIFNVLDLLHPISIYALQITCTCFRRLTQMRRLSILDIYFLCWVYGMSPTKYTTTFMNYASIRWYSLYAPLQTFIHAILNMKITIQ
ncbi:hypothetical protein ACJX0J_036504 [Zea mays]